MKIDRASLRNFVRESLPGFGQLSTEAQGVLIDRVNVSVAPPGDVLMAAGESADGVLLVHSGVIEIAQESVEGSLRRTGWRSRGDLIGITAMLTGERSTLTATVRRHAVVLTLDGEISKSVLLTNNQVLTGLAAARLAQTSDDPEGRPGAFVVAIEAVGLVEHVEALERTFRDVCARRQEIAFLSKSLAHAEVGAFEEIISPSQVAWLHDSEAEAEVAVLFAANAFDLWGEACRARADHVFALVHDDPSVDHLDGLRRIRDTARSSEVAVHAGAAARQSKEDWWAGVSDRRPLVIDATDVDETAISLDNLLESQANPGWLRRFAIFSSLSDFELECIFEDIRWQPIAGGEMILEEGKTGGDVILVDAGRFQAFRATPAGEEVLADIGSGEIFGETTALTDPVMWVSVRALRDSYVGRISGERFRALLEEIPSMARGLSYGLAKRHRELGPISVEGPPKNVVVLPLTDSEAAHTFGRALADMMQAFDLDIAAVDPALIDGQLFAGASDVELEGPRSGAVELWLHRLEEDRGVVLLLTENRDSAWTRRCLRQADVVLLVGEADADPGVRELERPLFEGRGALRAPHLVLLQPAGIVEAQGTSRWLENRPSVVHHHVRANNQEDLARVVRRLLKRAVGIAFSGASSRGVAHLGVARGLRERNLPLDLTSGSSSGAAVAGLMVTGMPHDEMMAHAQFVLAGVGLKATRLQPPVTSLMSGKAFEFFLKGVLGDRRLEDQMLGCTLTAVDLNRHQLVRLRTGPIWLAARASMSLPFFWPPVWHGEHLLVDGGIMSYMPIEEILDECAGGLAVASDMDLNAGKDVASFEGYDHYGATLSGWKILAEKMAPGAPSHRYPNISDVLFHSMCIPSFAHQKRIQHLAEQPTVRFIRPPITADGFFTVDVETSKRYEQTAYEVAMRELEDARALTL